MNSTDKRDIVIEYDDTTGCYFIVWEPVVIGLGSTMHSALKDLQKAAHSGVDTMINLKLNAFKKGKEY